MTDTEKRRIQLLEQTRKMYSDKYNTPAVHPRYHSAYQSLYKTENVEEEQASSFGVRVIVAILLFCLFVVASQSDDMNTEKVVNMIEQEFQGQVDLPIPD